LTRIFQFSKSGRVRWTAIALLAASLAFAAVEAEAASKVHGAALDDNAKKVGENRYKSAEDWEKTIRFYRGVYGGKAGIVWSTIDTPPKVKAIHIANTLPKRTWEGINIYEVGGDIFIFVIQAEAEKR
jgi:hypothetical protein